MASLHLPMILHSWTHSSTAHVTPSLHQVYVKGITTHERAHWKTQMACPRHLGICLGTQIPVLLLLVCL